jgi:hypothetical protein
MPDNKLHFSTLVDSLNFKYNETDKIFEGDILLMRTQPIHSKPMVYIH